jgi:hypothetical protein
MTTVTNLTLAHVLSGVRQQDGFAKGRALRLAEQRAALEAPTAAVRAASDWDSINGGAEHGRAARISRRLRASFRSDLSPASHRRWIARILAGLPDVQQK